MDNETKRLTAVNLTVEHLYRAAKQLSPVERAALVDLMTSNDVALVLDAIASKLRSAEADKKEDDR
jgi:hypothetical protein